MGDQHVFSAAELEQLSPDERNRIVAQRSTTDVSQLDSDFRTRVESTGRRLLEEHGLLDPEPR